MLQNCLLTSNSNISDDLKKKYQKSLQESLRPDNALKLKIKTMKYGGTETGKSLALFTQVSFDYNNSTCPSLVIVYAICVLLSTLKQEILGQEIAPLTILKILLNDYFESAEKINESRCYVEEKQAALFPKE